MIPLFEAGEADGVLFLAMRYVEGTDLRTLIDARRPARRRSRGAHHRRHRGGARRRPRAGPRPPRRKARQRADRHAGRREHVYLTDFGLTKQAGSAAGMTRTGQWVGTIDYVAPEQIEGKRTDARADIYALGCVLYAALTAHVPFERPTDPAKLFAHMSDPPPRVTDLRPDVPAEMDAVVERAMAKSPEDRFPSAGDLGRAAISAAHGTSLGSSRADRRQGRRRPGAGRDRDGDGGAANGSVGPSRRRTAPRRPARPR